MDIKQAQGIVKDTLQNTFDKARFTHFIKELLNHIEEAPFIYRGNLIPDAYDKFISSFERVGKYTDGENKLEILIVNLKKETSLERARAMQRNFIAWYLNGSRGGELKDAALVAFVSPNQDDWRFSLVKMDYKFEEGKGGRIKVKEDFTPARRWSFLVGKNENSHTAQSKLAPAIEDESIITLQRLEEVFNIEVVTKEFFEKYRELFHLVEEHVDAILKKDSKIKSEFESKKVSSVDFSKKLLGQIVFLYFLQKKGWFGVERDADWGTGPKNFLRLLLERKIAKYDCFFNDILEPLFYEALNKERDGDFYSKLDCKIPFLNGELFDPIKEYDWVHTDILLSDNIFSNKERTKQGDIGTGILDVFDRYNFTVKEDEPLEKDVAIDPEMLGKVFENLLEVKDRKSKGTYYTPREIVHYMCQESLVSYLTTEYKDKVSEDDVRFLIQFGESAVEHEAFIGQIGKETSTYYHKLPESIRKNAEVLDKSLADIRVCDPAIGSGAFPVGMMNEVIRTRNALTNFIKNKDGRTIYEFKRHAIQHCLYGVDIDLAAVEIAKLRLWLSLVVDEDDIKKIKPLPNLDFRIVQGDSLLGVELNLFNQQQFAELEELKPLYFDETNLKKKHGYKKRIDALIKDISNNNQNFDYKVYFSEVFHEKDGFNVVIANPPYITYKGKDVVNISSAYVERLISLYPNSAEYKVNSYALFIEKGVSLLKKNGTLVYIIPSTILQNEYLKKIRRYLITKYHISQIVSFANKIFEAVTDSIILGVNNNHDVELKTTAIRKHNLDFSDLHDSKIYYQNKWNNDADDFVINLKTNEDEDGIISKIENKAILLGVLLEANIGIKRANAPIINKQQDRYKKFLVGRNINKYLLDFPNTYILFDKSLFHTGIDENIFEEDEKVLVRKTGNKLIAVIDSERYYTDQSIYNLYIKKGRRVNLKIITALLNSSLLDYYFNKKMITNPDVFPYIKGIHLKKLPLKFPKDEAGEKEIEALVLRITELKRGGKDASIYEKQIDQLVYKLYGLSPEEIKIVEDSNKN
ncbi:MAG: hypothetical protein A2817_02225 [Candidatus Yanofskybacteria bacterium RIFCSPHIGHO2_01_FULL_39_8b]|uniref:site-specific DNA-methyltransferase (adenine-specific) n=1 Tax=Candidatus Yanofskybacteria bacterium RIFCSPHIGHO2_01_FULL_39_8b TaxID=1802659 RepID=A0A1F8EGZ2_9BACT|nr:MAG: hypothetical protein A2817_02225 [Candidatus Yanofskybacteria bacterium RIFCSPHIGHO2_01_FULL_39_8b]